MRSLNCKIGYLPLSKWFLIANAMVKLALQCMQLNRPGICLYWVERKRSWACQFDGLIEGGQLLLCGPSVQSTMAFKLLQGNWNFCGLGTTAACHSIVTCRTTPFGRWDRINSRHGLMGGLLMSLQATQTQKKSVTCGTLME